MIALVNGVNKKIREETPKYIGSLVTPGGSPPASLSLPWAIDCGAFHWSARKYITLLRRHEGRQNCLFCTLPDIPGNAKETHERSIQWIDQVKKLGYPIAWVIQDGQEKIKIPWNDIDAVFLGATDEWRKKHALRFAYQAAWYSKWIHIGRVGSYKKLKWARSIGANSIDSTWWSKNKRNFERLKQWLIEVNDESYNDQ